MTITIQRKQSTPAVPQSKVEHPQAKVHPYYNYGPILSHNASYNFIVGGRGLGKTYGAKRLAIRNYLKTDNGVMRRDMFIYLRRYKDELTKSRDTFFADIEHEFPDWDFRANGNVFEMSPITERDQKKRHWDTIGYAIALSTAQQQKSVAFPKVKTIIFDEFIIEKGAVHYLPAEANTFNNFYSTVDRWQDKTRVFFLANSISITNPYFIEYQIVPTEPNQLIKAADGFIVAHFPNALDFERSVMATRFGKFIEGKAYADYAVGNQFADNHQELVEAKDPDSDHKFNLETRLGWVSVWQNVIADQYYVSRRIPPNQLTFTLLPEQMAEGKMLLFYTDDVIARLRTAFRYGKITFDMPATRNAFLDVFHRKA